MNMSAICEHGLITKICQWCQRDMARAGFAPMWAIRRIRRSPGKTAIQQAQYDYAKELVNLARERE